MKVPEIRFEQYKEPFKHVQLGDLTKKSKILNKRGQNKNLLSLSYGKIVRKDIESKKGLLPGSFNSYQIIQKNSIIFRCTDLQNDKKSLRVGLSMQEGIISPAYIRMDCDTTQVLPEYLFNQLHYHDSVTKVYYTMGDGLRQTLSFEDLKGLDIYLPNFSEQQDIVNYFQSLDGIILSTTKKVEKLKRTKEASLVAMFPQKGETKPKVRFKGFEGDWRIVSFGSLIKECEDKSLVENEDVLLTSAITGMYLNSEIFGHQRGRTNVGYRKLRKNMLVLSAQNLHLGNANVNLRFEHGLVSPAYKIYDLIDINPQFMHQWIKREETKKFFLDATTAGASLCRKNIVWEDLYKQTLRIPSSLQEQEQLGKYFTTLDKQISLEEQKLESLKRIKSACLDKMFI